MHPTSSPTQSADFDRADTIGKRKLFTIVLLTLSVVAGIGFNIAEILLENGMAGSDWLRSDNMFYHLFATYDRWHLAIFIVATLAFVGFLFFGRQTEKTIIWPRISISLLSFAVIAVTAAGVHLIFLNYPFAMDEFYPDFQSKLFAHGQLWGSISENLTPIARAATPPMMNFQPLPTAWTSNYLPVYALLRLPFLLVGFSWLLNPLLAGASVWLLAAVVGKIWPDSRELPLIGALLLASSPQFLMTSMTAYAMPAHVCLNLLWLLLFLKNGRIGFWLPPWLGICAMGLHQPNIHVLFVAPFILRLLWKRDWSKAGYYLAVYAAGSAFWLQFMKWKTAILPAVAENLPKAAPENVLVGLLHLFRMPNLQHLLDHLIGLTEILSWNSWALVFFSALGLFAWKKSPPVIADLLTGLILALDCFLLFPENQGHGWGNRYFYSYMPNFVLLGMAGFCHFRKNFSRAQLDMAIAISLIVFCLQLPLRAWSCRDVVEPFALASEYLHTRPVETVILDTNCIWYGQDLVRNEPGLEKLPRIVFLRRLDAASLMFLEKKGKYEIVNDKTLAAFGIHSVLAKSQTPTTRK